MRRSTYGFLVFVAIATAIWIGLWNHRNGSTDVDKVTVGQVGEFFLYMPLYIAKDKGFFQQERLDVTIVNTGGDEKSVAAVISGSVDFGIGDPTFAAIAGVRGQKVKVIASVVNGAPFWGVTKKASVREITHPSQLRGLTVGTFPAPSTAFTLQAQMFRSGGLEPSIRQAQFGALLPLLDMGTVDIVLELEPNVSTAVARGSRVVYSMAQTYGDFLITGVTVAQHTLDKRRHVAERFVKALDRAERFAHEKPDEAISFARSRFSSIEPNIAESAMRRILESGTLPKNARVSAVAWQRAVKLRVDAGELPSVESAMPFIDDSLVPNNP